MRNSLIFAFLLSLMLSGCGYTTQAILPAGEPSIHVENFVNKIDVTGEVSDDKTYYAYVPAMESDITREVIDRFIFDGNYEIKSAGSANFLLKGELVDYRRESLRYDSEDDVIEYRVSVVVNLELLNSKESRVLWQENNFAGESTYRRTGEFAKSESLARQEAVRDLARRIVERTVEDW